MTITVFTPLYNRGNLIGKLYGSLCRQTFTDFEWVVVNDGSTDDSETKINQFLHEKKFPITYVKTENGGKHRAINKGLQMAKGELFFIADSDDFLTDDALMSVVDIYAEIRERADFAGVSGCSVYPDGKRIGGEVFFDTLDCTPLERTIKYHIGGDMAEIWKTEILKHYPFPDIEGEKFCPEALIWNQIAQKYKIRYFNKGIKVCEYFPDGMTVEIVRIRMQSCKASMLFYSQLYHYKIPFTQKLKAAANFWRFAACSTDVAFGEKIKQIGIPSLICYPLGIVMHLKDKRRP